MQGLLRSHISTVISRNSTAYAGRSPPFFPICFKSPHTIFQHLKRFSSPTSYYLKPSSPFINHLNAAKNVHKFFISRSVTQHLLFNYWLKNLSIRLRNWNFRLLGGRSPWHSSRITPSFPSFKRNWRSQLNGLDPEHVVYGLIAANVAVFLLWRIANKNFMVDNFMISLDNFKSGRVHTLLTSAFSHLDFGHLFSNMIGLYFFGNNIGRLLGPEYLLKLYLAGAIGGSVLYLIHKALMVASTPGQSPWFRDPSRIPGLGASGAVNAILLLDIFLNPKATIYFNFFIPIPAMLFGIFLIGKDMWRMAEGDSNISGSAHLGGAAVAAIAWLRIKRGRF